MSSEAASHPAARNGALGVLPVAVTPAAAADQTAIWVENVSKCYHIYSKPRDRLKQVVTRRLKTYYRPFWALHDVSFEVKRGEALGIVGRNGSGKSTLLQIIAGTLTPTSGEVRLRGRVAALLELGSGFNPEFTGRDNVFLNAAILGIPRREMEERFDEIAAFADIGDFLDQPVKHYSSGMHARLAFSVAISVSPDILILDEILAVGDVGFQQKCVARLRKLLDSGVTLLFVSHGPDAVKSLCQKGLFLSEGKAAKWGTAGEAVDAYVEAIRAGCNIIAGKGAKPAAAARASQKDETLRYGTGDAHIDSVEMLDGTGKPASIYKFGEEIVIEILCTARHDVERVDVTFVIRDYAGVDLLGSGTANERVALLAMHAGESARIRFRLKNCLRSGSYGVSVTLTQIPAAVGELGVTLDNIDAAAAFQTIADASRWVVNKVYVPVAAECEVLAPKKKVAAAGSW